MGKSKKFKPDFPKVKSKKAVRKYIADHYDTHVYTIGSSVRMERDDFSDLRNYYDNR